MADKHLSESEWIKFSKGKAFKDAALRKALVALDKAKAPAAELEATAELQKQVASLRRDAKNDKAALEYLANMGKAADKCQTAAEASLKAAAKQTEQAAAKQAEQARQAERDKKQASEDDDPAILTTGLKSLLQQVQRGSTMFAMIVTDGGKVVGVMLSRRSIAPSKAKIVKDYLGLSAAKPPMLGQCIWEARAITFVVESKVTGLARKLVKALHKQTDARWKVRVRGSDPDDVDTDDEDDDARQVDSPAASGAKDKARKVTPDGRAKVSAKVSMAPPGPPSNFITAGAKAPPAGQVRPGVQPVSTQRVAGAGGKQMSVLRTPEGKVVLKAPAAPVEQVTFSGGGGKGAAYPGAIHALEDSGVLKTLKVVTGASVGSMTAALIAAGMTADEFENLGNDPAVADQIKEGHGVIEAAVGGGLSGEGMQALVRNKMKGTVGKRVAEYVAAQQKAGQAIDPRVLQIGKKLAGGQQGPTFGDLRTLSQFIPAIKEVVISGTLMGTVEPKTMMDMVEEGVVDGLVNAAKLVPGVSALSDMKKMAERNMGNDLPDPNKLVPAPKPIPYVFSADTEPDLEVALAVRASAAFPGVFKPVDIPLKSGKTARFQDGGVLNNAPTLRSVGMEREVDPVPQKRNLTFLFGDETSGEIVKGKAPLPKNPVNDLLSGADNNAAEYWKNLDLARHREEVIALPMTFTNDQDELVDASGLAGGTLKFDMPLEDKRALQAQAKVATEARLAAEGQAKDCPFDSIEEMLTCIPRADLAAMAADGFDGAAEALDFRDKVTETVGRVLARAAALAGRGAPSAMGRDAEVVNAFERLESLAEGSKPRQAFVAREINRHPRLDDLMTVMRRKGGAGGAGDALKASLAMNDALQLQARVESLLREVLIPKRVHEDADSIGGELLKQVQGQLLKVKSAGQANALLMHVIEYYEKPLPMPPPGLLMPAPPAIPRDKAFADALRARLLKA